MSSQAFKPHPSLTQSVALQQRARGKLPLDVVVGEGESPTSFINNSTNHTHVSLFSRASCAGTRVSKQMAFTVSQRLRHPRVAGKQEGGEDPDL